MPIDPNKVKRTTVKVVPMLGLSLAVCLDWFLTGELKPLLYVLVWASLTASVIMYFWCLSKREKTSGNDKPERVHLKRRRD